MPLSADAATITYRRGELDLYSVATAEADGTSRRRSHLAVIVLLWAAILTAPAAAALADDDDDDDGGGGALPAPVTLASGESGAVCSTDPNNEFRISHDAGLTWSAWSAAHIVDNHPAWAEEMTGSDWISIACDRGGEIDPITPLLPENEVQYRRSFSLPAGCAAATLSVLLHVDNDAEVFLNGVEFGETAQGPVVTNFQLQPEGPYETLVTEQDNELLFHTSNFGYPTGLDYVATLTCTQAADDDDDDDDDAVTMTTVTTTVAATTIS